MSVVVREGASLYAVRLDADERDTGDAMFSFFKRRPPGADDEPIGPTMFDEANSPEERELERVAEHVDDLLDTLRVDVKRRKFIGEDGVALGITGLARRIHTAEPGMAIDDIEQSITDWLEQSYCPDGISQARMKTLQAQIESWIEAHGHADKLWT